MCDGYDGLNGSRGLRGWSVLVFEESEDLKGVFSWRSRGRGGMGMYGGGGGVSVAVSVEVFRWVGEGISKCWSPAWLWLRTLLERWLDTGKSCSEYLCRGICFHLFPL